MDPRNHVLHGFQIPKDEGQFLGLSGILKTTASHCCVVHAKKSITTSVHLLQPTALFLTGWCHVNFSQVKNLPTSP